MSLVNTVAALYVEKGGVYFGLNGIDPWEIRKYGGVLEHPGSSHAWARYGLIRPYGEGWCYQPDTSFVAGRGGYPVCEVWQSAYGHRAAKRTWLLYAGQVAPTEMNWDRVAGTHQVGYPDRRGKARNKPTLSKKEAAATPPLFRDALIMLARKSRGEINSP